MFSEKQSKSFRHLLLTIVLGVLYSCQPAQSSIKYLASGDGGALSVNYVDATGTSRLYTGGSPFELEFEASSGAQLSLSGSSGPNGKTTVDIYINGTDKAHDTETGAKASATATVP